MKNILVVSYSQTGQLDDIITNFLSKVYTANIDRVKIAPKTAFPFPWTTDVFFDIMPETVLEEPIELAEFTIEKDKYDLIILGYQPWFLSPSMPITALFAQEKFTKLLHDTPVITITGARNMWINSQISLVDKIQKHGGHMIGHLPFIDKTQNHVSALTILHWMSTGKKTRRWGILPLPGVSDEDIASASDFGAILNESLIRKNYDNLQKRFIEKGKLSIESSIMLIESRAIKLFRVWANLIKKNGTTPVLRKKWINRFHWYLIVALFVVSPPIVLIHYLLRPVLFMKIRKNRKKLLYLGIEH